MKLWLDDVRSAPEGWEHAHTVSEAKDLMNRYWDRGGQITHISLDHDLGNAEGGDAPVFLDWIVENDLWPTEIIVVHSSNPVGVQNMLRTIDRYGPYPLGYGTSRSY